MANALIPIPSAVPSTATMSLRNDFAGASLVGVNPNLDGSGGSVTSWAPGTAKYAATGSYILTATLTDGGTQNYPIVLAPAPASTAGANAGGTPPVPVTAATASDVRGNVTFGTGTSPAAGAQVVVAFAVTKAAVPGSIHLISRTSATQALGLYVSAITTSGFTVSTVNAPAASQANTVYSLDYLVTT